MRGSRPHVTLGPPLHIAYPPLPVPVPVQHYIARSLFPQAAFARLTTSPMSTNASSSTRSSSPETSESLSERPSLDFSQWLNHPFTPDSNTSQDLYSEPKLDDGDLQMLDELIHDGVHEPILPESPIAINPAVFQAPGRHTGTGTTLTMNIFSNFSTDYSSSESATFSDLVPRTTHTTASVTKVEPPPPVQPRKMDTNACHRVIFPARESCNNLTILTPNIPQTGTKSRVETQVRVALDLAFATPSTIDLVKYDKVGSWKWLKLPKGTATRKRSRKEGKIDASPSDTLYLEAEVICSSNPSKHVASCNTCQGREAKRVARKIASRVRPARSDSDSNESPSSREGESSSNILQFNCPDTLDFTGGSVVLPLRITCYCRHHREKVGFNVRFALKDASDRIIGRGMSPPIMITDDHKSTDKGTTKPAQSSRMGTDADWETRTPSVPSTPAEVIPYETGAPSRRRQSATKDACISLKKRPKPYDPGRTAIGRFRRSDVTEGISYPAAVQTDGNIALDLGTSATCGSTPLSAYSTAPPSPSPQERQNVIVLPSPVNSHASPISPQPNFLDTHDAIMHEALLHSSSFYPITPPVTAPSSPPMSEILSPSLSSSHIDLSSFTYSLLQPHAEATTAIPSAKIHRLIPSSGPTFGGVEITVLGSNFHSSVLYNCVFGDVIASSTTRWSENTLVCVLPPRACAGIVPVTLAENKAGIDLDTEPVLFTYTDESDRALMELALQVVGLKMTGKIEDAKDIAMRIVGTTSSSAQNTSTSVNEMISLANGILPNSRRVLSRQGDAELEMTIIESLSCLDSHSDVELSSSPVELRSKTGQTLLHLACLLNFPSLAEFLIQREIDINAQDINGCTALHFAFIGAAECCARVVVNAGADVAVVDKMGRAISEVAPEGFFSSPLALSNQNVAGLWNPVESDEESNFGDIEEDSGDEHRLPSRPHSRTRLRRRLRPSRSVRSSKAVSVASENSDVEDNFEYDPLADDDDNATIVSPESILMKDSQTKGASMDEKEAASFAVYLQRAWAQLQTPQLIPQMPHMPQFPGMPAWVFPVFVPMPAWPPFRGEKRNDSSTPKDNLVDGDESRAQSNEWRAYWEKWTAAAMARQNQMEKSVSESVTRGDELPAQPEYEFDKVSASSNSAGATVSSRSFFRRLRYTPAHTKVYSHRNKAKSLVKPGKKSDRMLVIFWIPILLLAIGWALYTTFPIASTIARQILPFQDVIDRLTLVR